MLARVVSLSHFSLNPHNHNHLQPTNHLNPFDTSFYVWYGENL